MKIGVISDTHGFFDPCLKEILTGVELILHGGDIDDQVVLDQLSRIAPVRAVRGNVDPLDLNLPLSLELAFGGLRVEMMHRLPVLQSEVQKWSLQGSRAGKAPPPSEAFLKTFSDRTGVVIFGHSHEPCLITLGNRLFFNPGSAGKKRFSLPRCCGLLETFPGGIRASIRSLEPHPGRIPVPIRLEFGD